MLKVNLFVLNKDLEKLSSLLYDLKLMQFFRVEHEEFQDFEHTDLSEKSRRLLELRSATAFLKGHFTKKSSALLKDSIEQTKEWRERLEKSEKRILTLDDELKRSKIVEKLKIKERDLEDEHVSVGFLPLHRAKELKLLKEHNIKFRKFNKLERIYFIAYSTEIPFEFTEYYLPQDLEKGLKTKLDNEEAKLEKIKASLNKIANGNLKHLEAELTKLTKEVKSQEAREHFLKTENFAALSGFVPEKKKKLLLRELESNFADRFAINFKDAGKDAPTHLEHSAVPNNFVALLKMYSLPKYNELDPTILMMLTFPLFFGFILGDVIYGIISLIFFTYLKKKMPQIKSFMSILQLSAISSIIFGVIFGEFMGFEFHGAFYGFFERAHHPETLLIFALIFGLVHINLGLLFGILNHIKHPKEALTHSASWMILQAGAGLLAWGVISASAIFTWIGSATLLLSAVLIYMGHGFIGLIEIPSFFSNIFSYARLMAVGLSSVAIALLINEFSVPLFSSGILGILGGILLFTFGHIFNIVLGNFEGFVHTLRLHYVEYFTKFYSGDGQEFKPFGEVQEQDGEAS